MGVGARARGAAVAAAVVLLALATTARGADYWVKNGGNDGQDGLSVGTAWATLVHAAGEVGPGDTVHVLDGSYQGFYLTASGTAGSLVLPGPAGVRTTVVLGAASECGSVVWNGPGGASPRCTGDAARLVCK